MSRLAIASVPARNPLESFGRDGWNRTDVLPFGAASWVDLDTGYVSTTSDRDEFRAIVGGDDELHGWGLVSFDVAFAFARRRDSPEHRDFLAQHTDRFVDLLRKSWITRGLDPDKFDARSHSGWSLDNVAIATVAAEERAVSPWSRDEDKEFLGRYTALRAGLITLLCEHLLNFGYLIGPRDEVVRFHI